MFVAFMKISTSIISCFLEGVTCGIIMSSTGKKPKKELYKK